MPEHVVILLAAMMVSQTGFEPVASAFGGRCAIQLRHWDMMVGRRGIEPRVLGLEHPARPSGRPDRGGGTPEWNRTTASQIRSPGAVSTNGRGKGDRAILGLDRSRQGVARLPLSARLMTHRPW
jgi:hypothetical protein